MPRGPSLIALALCVATGCAPRPPYSFPGCEDAGGECSGGATWECAQGRLASRFDACAVDSDCVLLPTTFVQCGSTPDTVIKTCTMSVRAEQAGAYRDEVANEAVRACDVTVCFTAGAGCDADTIVNVAACDLDAGRCIVERKPDAGPAL